jgi:signal transduction histidine kinase
MAQGSRSSREGSVRLWLPPYDTMRESIATQRNGTREFTYEPPTVRNDSRPLSLVSEPHADEDDVDTLLLRLHQIIHARASESEQIQQINAFAVEALECDFSSTYLLDAERDVYHLAGNVGASERVQQEFPHVEFPRGSIPILDVLEPNHLFEIADIEEQELFPVVLLRSLNVSSMLIIAIEGRDGIVGALTYGYRTRTGPFSDRQRRLAAGIARISGQTIDNSRLLESYRRASQIKSEFLATLSHELRTPVNVILGMSEMALDGGLEEPLAGFVHAIDRQGQTLASMINDLLDLSAIEANRIALESNVFDPRTIVTDTVGIWMDKARDRGLELEGRVDESVPAQLQGDARRAGQILSNLIGNAIKFTETGGVRVELIERERPDGFSILEFAVTDTGIGISPEGQAKLFEAFTRVHAESHRHYGGTGLGLAICKRLTALFHGEISVESQVDRGSTFRFTLRLVRPETPDHPSVGRGNVLRDSTNCRSAQTE